jgi:hypothetical protein
MNDFFTQFFGTLHPLGLTNAAMICGLIVAAIRLSMRLAVLEFKVQTMWTFQMRRGFTEVVNSGIGQVESPLTFNHDIDRALDPLRDELIDYGRTVLRGLPDDEALLMIEAQFGEELMKFVCVPQHLSHGACLLLALTIAKGVNSVRLPPMKKTPYRCDAGGRRWFGLLPAKAAAPPQA